MALVQSGNLLLASLGDCVGTVVHKDGTFEKISADHTPSMRPDECRRIRNQNGNIVKDKVEATLAVTRAFGNANLKHLVIAEPECREMKLSSNDDLLILSTDGLYNSMTNFQVVQRVR
jgi:serine/threonine protein phosphatase PrpC